MVKVISLADVLKNKQNVMKENVKKKAERILFYGRTLLFLLVLTFLLNCEIFNASAAAEAELSFDPASQSVNEGDSFTIDVIATPGTYDIANIDLSLTYDQTKLQLSSVSFGGQFTQVIAPVIPGDGTAFISGMMPIGQMISTPGTFVTLSFQALAASANSQISVVTESSGVYSDDPAVVGVNQLANLAPTAQVVINAPVKYSLGGTVSGLNGTLVLRNNGADDLNISANGDFVFSEELNADSTYAVTVATQPSGQTCAVANGTGTISGNVTDVAITCSDILPNTYTVGGSVSGIVGTAILRNNGADDLSVSADGSFVFPIALADSTAYEVTIYTQPSGQTCAVSNGSGTISSANITNVILTCENDEAETFTVGGTVSGLNGTVILQNNGEDDLSINSNGSFLFPTALNSGDDYVVTISSQPTGQVCSVANGSGTVLSNVENISVVCVDDAQECESFVYSDWGTCSNGVQTRSIISSTPSVCEGGLEPVISQNCLDLDEQEVCSSFTYSDWGACQQDGIQSRTITAMLPSGCSGGSPESLNQSCTYQSSSSNSDSSEHKKKKKKEKKKKSSKNKISQTPDKVRIGGVIIQTGKNFTKNSTVKAYFSKFGGGYYPPITIKTDKKGIFSVAYRVKKPASSYSWYVVDSSTGKKSKTKTYLVKPAK